MAKILIVDDSMALRAQVAESLRQGKHEIIEAGDGPEGLQKFIDNPDIKLVFADYNMPEMDGLAMSRKIKELPHGKHIPILMLTTESSSKLIATGKEIGVLAWIIKPLPPGERILEIIKKILKE